MTGRAKLLSREGAADDGFRSVADKNDLRDVLDMLILTLLAVGLLVCNLIYCGQRILADLRHSRNAQVALGLLASSGSLLALVAMVWVTLASLAHL